MTAVRRRKATFYLDEVKQRHTSHWDEDVLTRDQLETLHREATLRVRRYKRRQFAWIGAWLAVICLLPTALHWLGWLLGARG